MSAPNLQCLFQLSSLDVSHSSDMFQLHSGLCFRWYRFQLQLYGQYFCPCPTILISALAQSCCVYFLFTLTTFVPAAAPASPLHNLFQLQLCIISAPAMHLSSSAAASCSRLSQQHWGQLARSQVNHCPNITLISMS